MTVLKMEFSLMILNSLMYYLHSKKKINSIALRPATLLEKESPAQVFSCEICEIFKNTFFYRTPLVAASEMIPDCEFFSFTITHYSKNNGFAKMNNVK